MRLLVLSDLHREVWRDAPGKAQEALSRLQPDIAASCPDVVILAGDIDVGRGAVAWADRAFPQLPVLYVSGNHEGYGHKIDALRQKLAQECAATGHVHYLDRSEYVIGDVRFLGATLWTDFQLMGSDNYVEAQQAASAGMNDYRRIRLEKQGYRRVRPLDSAQWHQEDKNWLQAKLDQPFSGATVVVTHMAPSERSIPDRFKGQLLSAAFASNLDSLVAQSDLWVHGHVHDSMDYTIGSARVVCNPLGYPLKARDGKWHAENPAYDPGFIVQI